MLVLCIRDLLSFLRHDSPPPTIETLSDDDGWWNAHVANPTRRFAARHRALIGLAGLLGGGVLATFSGSRERSTCRSRHAALAVATPREHARGDPASNRRASAGGHGSRVSALLQFQRRHVPKKPAAGQPGQQAPSSR
jgi:hypothetical protein